MGAAHPRTDPRVDRPGQAREVSGRPAPAAIPDNGGRPQPVHSGSAPPSVNLLRQVLSVCAEGQSHRRREWSGASRSAGATRFYQGLHLYLTPGHHPSTSSPSRTAVVTLLRRPHYPAVPTVFPPRLVAAVCRAEHPALPLDVSRLLLEAGMAVTRVELGAVLPEPPGFVALWRAPIPASAQGFCPRHGGGGAPVGRLVLPNHTPLCGPPVHFCVS